MKPLLKCNPWDLMLLMKLDHSVSVTKNLYFPDKLLMSIVSRLPAKQTNGQILQFVCNCSVQVVIACPVSTLYYQASLSSTSEDIALGVCVILATNFMTWKKVITLL